jgi:hypothetical protein
MCSKFVSIIFLQPLFRTGDSVVTKKIDEQNDTPSVSREKRRKVLKGLAAGGGVASAATVSGDWTKPIIEKVTLPAHGQTTGTLTSCNLTVSSEGGYYHNGFLGTVDSDWTAGEGQLRGDITFTFRLFADVPDGTPATATLLAPDNDADFDLDTGTTFTGGVAEFDGDGSGFNDSGPFTFRGSLANGEDCAIVLDVVSYPYSV